MIKKIMKIFVLLIIILMTGCFGKEDPKELNEEKLKQLTKIISDIQEYKNMNVRTTTSGVMDGIFIKSYRGYDYYNLDKLKSMTFIEKLEMLDKLDETAAESYVAIGNKTKLFFDYLNLTDLAVNGTDGASTIGEKTVVYNMETETYIYADGSGETGSPYIEMVLVPYGITSLDNCRIAVSESFYISKYEVTQLQWKEIMEGNKNNISETPSYFKGKNGTLLSNNPVEQVSWYAALVFCNRLSIKEGLNPVYIKNTNNPDDWGATGTNWENFIAMDLSANGYRLPFAEEWEYAARGGAKGNSTTYSGSDNLDEVAWYNLNSSETNVSNLFEGKGTNPKGKKQKNELGIYDMSGNVYELCQDNFENSTVTNRYRRVKAGGSWESNKTWLDLYLNPCGVSDFSSIYAYQGEKNTGLRLVRRINNKQILSSIEIKKLPIKINYNLNNIFSEEGMEVEATYTDGSKKIVVGWETDSKNMIMNTSGISTINVYYEEGGVTKHTYFNINILEKNEPDMVFVPAGTTNNENGKITVPNSFYIGKYEITQQQWKAVMTGNLNGISTEPSFNKYTMTGILANNPVENINFYEILVFCNKLSSKEGLIPVYSINGSTNPNNWGKNTDNINILLNTLEINNLANGYKIPSFTEWTYAARGGDKNLVTKYSGSNRIEAVAWFSSNANKTNLVGEKAYNELGIYDMTGNVSELICDIYNRDIYLAVNGGDWYTNSDSSIFSNFVGIRIENTTYSPYTGFRIARTY